MKSILFPNGISMKGLNLPKFPNFYSRIKYQHNVLLRHYNSRILVSRPNKNLFLSIENFDSSTTNLHTSLRMYGRKVFQEEHFDVYDNSDENAMPDFPVTPEATWVFFQHIVKYFNENAWEYHGLKDIIKGLLVDFRVHLEKVMLEKQEREAQVLMSHALDNGTTKKVIHDSDSDPEDINEIVKNQTPGKIVKAKLKDLISDPEIERSVYANFLIEVAQRIVSVYKESMENITDTDSKEFAKEQFGDLVSCLEMHIHTMANLTYSPEIPDWAFEKYKLIAGPVLYNYLLEAAVELGDSYVYGNLLRKMKDDHVGLNQYSFQLMMRFGEKATKNNLIYAEELLNYMKSREIEPDEETIETYNRIKEKFSSTVEQEPSVFEDIYNESLTGSNLKDTLPKVHNSSQRMDITDSLDFKSDQSENLLKEALRMDKYKMQDETINANFGNGFESSIEGLNFGDTDEGDDIIRKIVEGESESQNTEDDIPPFQDSFGANMAQWYKQQRPLNHPSKKPVLPDYTIDEDEASTKTEDVFTKYKQTAQKMKRGADATGFKELGKVQPLSKKKFENTREDHEDTTFDSGLAGWKDNFENINEEDVSKLSLNEGDLNILNKFGLSPEELSNVFNNSPGTSDDMEDVKNASNSYQKKLQEASQKNDSAYAVKEKFYDSGFFDPYSQPIKGYDPSIADSFEEQDFFVEDPYKKDFNRKDLSKKTKKQDLIYDAFDAYGEIDFEKEMKIKAKILEKQKSKEGQINENQEPDTWCDPKLKL